MMIAVRLCSRVSSRRFDHPFRFGVDVGGGFVHDHYAGVEQEGARERQQLLLAGGE